MMIFREVLQGIVERTEGCQGSLIMGTDGIAVEKVWKPVGSQVNLDVAVAEYTSLLRTARRINKEIGFGKLREFTLSGESGVFLLRFLSEYYFIALILSPEGNFGRGRYELRRAELLLEKEFAI
jgi:predicted regulator of Ras-like GTPase activity (Roadblock/LC7/MglB family)